MNNGVFIEANYMGTTESLEFTNELMKNLTHSEKTGMMEKIIRMVRRVEFISRNGSCIPLPENLKG